MPLLERIGQPLGASGVPLLGNELWRTDEYNVDLASPQAAVATYDKMWRSDAKVRESGNNLIHALLAAQWRIDATDTPNGEEHAEFVRSVLMPGETYGYSGLSPWLGTLRNVCKAIVDGVTVLEKVWGYRPRDGKQVYAALELRPAKTIRYFSLTPTGPAQLESVTQTVQLRSGAYDDVTIPANLCIVHSVNREGDNFWGESILRPAHFHWRVKRDLIKWDAIHSERLGGIFWVSVREGAIPTPEQIRDVKLVLENFRIYEKLGLYIPSVFELHAVFPSTSGTDFITSVEYHDRQIEGSMGSQYQSLGTGEKGALSVGEVQLDQMLLANQGYAKGIEDTFGQQAIVDLIDTNFGEQEFYPRLACENFLQMKPDRLATVMAPLLASGAIRIDKPLRVYFRDRLSLPEEDEATMEPSPAELAQQIAEQAQTENAEKETKEKPEERSEKIQKRAVTAYGYFWRDALPHEQGVAWSEMQRYLDQHPSRLWYRDVLPIREKQIETLAKLAGEATDAQLAAGSLPKAELKALGDALATGLLDSYRKGREMVLAEARRARGDRIGKRSLLSKLGRFFKAEDDEDDLEDEYPTEPSKKESTWIRRLGQALALGMTLSLIREAVSAGQMAQDQELQTEDRIAAVRRALEDLSQPSVQADISGKVVQAYTTGRIEQLERMGDQIEEIYYSSLLDSNTCAPCEAMDGAKLDLEDFGSQVPNPRCDGGDRCRCEPVPVWRVGNQREAA